MKRNKVIDAVKEMPNDFELDELIEKLIFIEKIDLGLKEVEENKTIEHENVKKQFKQWSK